MTYGKDSGFRINTADGPPTELPSVARLITHSRDKASAPLKLIFGSVVPHIWAPSVMWTFSGHMLNKCLFIPDRAPRVEAKKWFYPSAAWGTTKFNGAYWVRQLTGSHTSNKNVCPSPSNQKLTILFTCIRLCPTINHYTPLKGTVSLKVSQLCFHSQNCFQ